MVLCPKLLPKLSGLPLLEIERLHQFVLVPIILLVDLVAYFDNSIQFSYLALKTPAEFT